MDDRRRTAGPLVGALALACAACGGPGLGPGRVPVGLWGGEHVSLRVTASDATLEFDCASGYIGERLRVDGEGRFEVSGTFVQERGGPIRDGEPKTTHPARYEGSTDGRMLSFVVRLTDVAQTIGPYRAFLGAPPRLFRCL